MRPFLLPLPRLMRVSGILMAGTAVKGIYSGPAAANRFSSESLRRRIAWRLTTPGPALAAETSMRGMFP
jgi:hypothetical protein